MLTKTYKLIMSKTKYNVKDKVFAKLRGHPAWPAIVYDINDDQLHPKYYVFFYGTNEHALCRPNELFPYEKYKSAFGKPNKRKYFKEALHLIENSDKIPDFTKDIKDHQFLKKASKERKLLEIKQSDVKFKKPLMKFTKMHISECLLLKNIQPVVVIEKLDDREIAKATKMQNYQKDTTDTLTMVTDDEKLPINCNNVSTNTNFNISRSGRIIKRKIYNNENNEVVPKPTKFSKDNGTISNEHYKNSNIEGPSEVNGTIKVEETRKKSILHARTCIVTKDFKVPINNISKNKKLPPSQKSHIIRTSSKFVKKYSNNDNEFYLLQIEYQLLENTHKLRSSLKSEMANYDTAISTLKNLLKLPFTKLMLKKHEEVVDTLRKVTFFCGSPNEWNSSHKKQINLHSTNDVQKIRHLANMVYHKCKFILLVLDD